MSGASVLLAPLAKRYIAGTDRTAAISAAKLLNEFKISTAIDNLGENVKDAAEAETSVSEYLELLSLIKTSGVDANISLKLTHMGLDISEELARKNAGRIIEKARELGNFVRFDMEGSAYTQKTIDAYLILRGIYENAGIAVQSALKRSARDIDRFIHEKASVRLVKGAYKEGADVAFQDKKDVDISYEALMKQLLLKGHMPAIATHDERLINIAKEFAESAGVDKGSFEFEMLLGIKRNLQKQLAEEGYRVRVYCPYGVNWLPYTLRRLTERKENFYFVLKNIFD